MLLCAREHSLPGQISYDNQKPKPRKSAEEKGQNDDDEQAREAPQGEARSAKYRRKDNQHHRRPVLSSLPLQLLLPLLPFFFAFAFCWSSSLGQSSPAKTLSKDERPSIEATASSSSTELRNDYPTAPKKSISKPGRGCWSC